MRKKMKSENISSDWELIKKVKKNDSDALQELVKKYGAVYDGIVGKINFQNNYTKQDMIDDKYVFFFEMAKTYNPNKNTEFSTYIYNMTRWSCFDKLKKDRKQNEALQLDIHTPEFDFSKTTHIIDKIRSFDERTQYIFMNRFFYSKKKKTFQEIGKELNLTYEGVRQIYLKHLKILKKSL